LRLDAIFFKLFSIFPLFTSETQKKAKPKQQKEKSACHMKLFSIEDGIASGGRPMAPSCYFFILEIEAMSRIAPVNTQRGVANTSL
jgi:hypothetical protein